MSKAVMEPHSNGKGEKSREAAGCLQLRDIEAPRDERDKIAASVAGCEVSPSAGAQVDPEGAEGSVRAFGVTDLVLATDHTPAGEDTAADRQGIALGEGTHLIEVDVLGHPCPSTEKPASSA
jgi:hypothetical protein